MKSIMQDKKDKTCYLCKLMYGDESIKFTQEHHVFFGVANRKLSEKYGLKVNLCLEHHTIGKEAVHNNKANDMCLKQIGQQEFEERYQDLNFREIFGRNYL